MRLCACVLVCLMFSCNDEDDSLRAVIVEPPFSSDCPLSMTETDFFTFDYASIKLEAAEDIREPSFQSLEDDTFLKNAHKNLVRSNCENRFSEYMSAEVGFPLWGFAKISESGNTLFLPLTDMSSDSIQGYVSVKEDEEAPITLFRRDVTWDLLGDTQISEADRAILEARVELFYFLDALIFLPGFADNDDPNLGENTTQSRGCWETVCGCVPNIYVFDEGITESRSMSCDDGYTFQCINVYSSVCDGDYPYYPQDPGVPPIIIGGEVYTCCGGDGNIGPFSPNLSPLWTENWFQFIPSCPPPEGNTENPGSGNSPDDCINNLSEKIQKLQAAVAADPLIALRACAESSDGLIFWEDLATFSPSEDLIAQREDLDDISFQRLQNATGPAVNADFFAVEFNGLPNLPGVSDANTLFAHIREKFLDFDDDCGEFEFAFRNPSIDLPLWNSDSPLSTVFDISIPEEPFLGLFSNDGSVMLTDINDECNCWTFSTLTTSMFLTGEHPVSGNRQFGIEQLPNGNFRFYTRGVDRMVRGSLDGFFAYDAMEGYTKAAAGWTCLVNEVGKYLQNEGGVSVSDPCAEAFIIDTDSFEDWLNSLDTDPSNGLNCVELGNSVSCF